MKNIRKKSVAVVAGLAIAGLASASAATLGGVATQGLGADVAPVESCDEDGVTVTYDTEYVSSGGGAGSGGTGYVGVTNVTIGSVAELCSLLDYEVTLLGDTDAPIDANGAAAGESVDGTLADWTTLGDANEFDVTVAAGVDAEAVYGIAIVISGNPIPTP